MQIELRNVTEHPLAHMRNIWKILDTRPNSELCDQAIAMFHCQGKDTPEQVLERFTIEERCVIANKWFFDIGQGNPGRHPGFYLWSYTEAFKPYYRFNGFRYLSKASL